MQREREGERQGGDTGKVGSLRSIKIIFLLATIIPRSTMQCCGHEC